MKDKPPAVCGDGGVGAAGDFFCITAGGGGGKEPAIPLLRADDIDQVFPVRRQYLFIDGLPAVVDGGVEGLFIAGGLLGRSGAGQQKNGQEQAESHVAVRFWYLKRI